MPFSSVSCYHCGEKNEFSDRLGFRAACEKCRTDLHACKACEFYDEKAYNSCREPSADVVQDKERANFCEFFSPSQKGAVQQPKVDLRAAAEALFKKK